MLYKVGPANVKQNVNRTKENTLLSKCMNQMEKMNPQINQVLLVGHFREEKAKALELEALKLEALKKTNQANTLYLLLE